MSPSSADNWSLTRAVGLLAAVFAIVFGSLMPFGALAAVQPGQALILCTAQGPQTIHAGGFDGPIRTEVGATCAACLLPVVADLPPRSPCFKLPAPASPAAATLLVFNNPPPPSGPTRLRPPSTAPPLRV